MDFPHIGDTAFPNIDTVDVYKYQNNFDYSRWQGKVAIKLLNVLWNSNYADVPYFENESMRDNWFNAQEGIIKTLESAFNITPDNSIKVPIPYNDAYKYNYLVVDMPIQTSEQNPIDYENVDTRVKRWYYFIDSMVQYAPNTTELFLTLDVWTTFINTVDIPYLMLERGHAPMFETSVKNYLSNPIENNEYLLAQDFNYGNDSRIISDTSYFPIGNGRKYVLFALPMTQADLITIGGAEASGDSTLPTFSSTTDRWGYQIVVNNYEWNFSAGNYNNARLPISAFLNADSVFNGNYIFAIASEDATSFFQNIANTAVHFLHALQGVFVVAEDMIKLGVPFTFKDTTVYQVEKQYNVYDLQLNKDAFGYDEKYSNITKLYTYPYSVLEITDDNGFTREVKIENTGNIQLHKEIALAFPFVRYQTFFTGFNGNGAYNYIWKNLNNQDVAKEIWESDFSVFMMNWDIPTYAVFVSAENEYASANWPNMQAARQGAIVDYENATRYANTNYENTSDSMDTAESNTNRTQAAMVANNKTACDNNTKITTEVHNVILENVKDAQNQKIEDDKNVASAVTITTAATQNELAAVALSHSLGASLNTAVVGSATSIVGGAASGGLVGAVGGTLSAVSNIGTTLANMQAASANTMASIGTRTDIANLTANANAAYAIQAQRCNNVVCQQTQVETSRTTQENNASATEQTNRNATTNNANIAATNNTETNNADWTRNANIAAAQSNLIQRQREWDSRFKNARLQAPYVATQYNGDAMPDVFERRGVRMNIRTQTKAAIAQAGDAMLRFGYALHRIWDMSSGFHYGKHFTFWKAEDIWINEGSGLAGNSVNLIGDILLKGVTVWRIPDEIGRVSIYDNM